MVCKDQAWMEKISDKAKETDKSANSKGPESIKERTMILKFIKLRRRFEIGI